MTRAIGVMPSMRSMLDSIDTCGRERVLNGTYDLPWSVLVAATYSAQSGEYISRTVRARNANNEAVDVIVEGQAGRYDWVRLLDFRVSKRVGIGKHTFEGMFDMFNALNTSVVLRQVTANGPDFGKPLSSGGIDAAAATAIPAARIFRLSARWKF